MTSVNPRSQQLADDAHIQGLVEAVLRGETEAKAELIHHACGRLLALTRRMFHHRSALRRWEETDDVFQNAMVRLHRALETCELQGVRHFFNLAAVQIRRELIDLGRKHFGPEGMGRNHHTDHQPGDDRGGSLHALEAAPADLAEWTEFHERVETLPHELREVVDLLYYEGLSQEDAARMLECSVRTVRRRWQEAKFLLHGGLSDGATDA